MKAIVDTKVISRELLMKLKWPLTKHAFVRKTKISKYDLACGCRPKCGGFFSFFYSRIMWYRERSHAYRRTICNVPTSTLFWLSGEHCYFCCLFFFLHFSPHFSRLLSLLIRWLGSGYRCKQMAICISFAQYLIFLSLTRTMAPKREKMERNEKKKTAYGPWNSEDALQHSFQIFFDFKLLAL